MILLLLPFRLALAQDSESKNYDYFEMPLEQLLSTKVLSVSKQYQNVSDSPAAVYIITQDDILRSGVRSIADALRMAPGVQVAQSDTNSWAISIRGFNSITANKLLVMIDGRTVYNPLFAGTYWEIQDLFLEDIDRIEVVRGPGGALWSANAVNGIIHVITKHSSETQKDLVTGLYGNEEEGTLSGRYGNRFQGDNFYRAYAKHTRRDSSRSPAGGQAYDEYRDSRSGFRIDWDRNITLQGDIYHNDSDQINSTPISVSPFALIEEETIESKGANLLSRWEMDQTDGSSFSIQSYLDYTRRDQLLLKDERVIMDVESQYNLVPMGRHSLIFGGGYRMSYDDLGNSNVISFHPASRRDDLFSAFLHDEITLVPETWFLTLSSKAEHNDYTGFEFQPSARLQWHPDIDQTLWLAVTRAVRTPSRLERDLDLTTNYLGTTPPTEVILSANKSFDTEKMIAYEAGYRRQITPDLAVDLAVFYTDYNDLATVGFLPSSTGTLAIQAINGMTAETYGAEIVSSWNINSQFKVTGSYSFLDLSAHVEHSNGFDLETAEGLSPHHQASLRASWNIRRDLTLDGSIYYVDQLHENDVDDYTRLDLNLGWQIEEGLRFNVTGQNLMDQSHREFSSPTSINASEIERSVFGKITWEF
ncbi:MAG: TonB-dependent receptor [Alphaproteobacteria bacterium]|nr:TonB-dependent receptor [Alphaproteobacteria bacterium]